MEKDTPALYIITGGPGSGKTTLLNELGRNGCITVPEEGRRVIKEQLSMNGEGLPWINKNLFAKLMFDASVAAYQEISRIPDLKTAFFDRGILDTIGYLKTENIRVPEEMKIQASAMVYHKNVFILPPWDEIYENDPERKQTPEEAILTFNCIKETYLEFGYHLIEVPKDTLQRRLQFILEKIGIDNSDSVIL
ncbi:AAA family ATPase [Chryseobacterium sp. WG14]|uniref:AAA family ATPase n=1 Tax=unclassified Chryseobacterium TaxID=2593645 RepID=UPI00211EA244|nr:MULTISPECIES: AAA family ATPase [unclassified Chryseobacterium]MCQ9636757.1 AAA family ATPase [Chryseobacterium sp. WG23]MCQ9639374.1 AAA family ATPase [Chryseobacterium sp. WG14]